MPRAKRLTLAEARRTGQLNRFAKQNAGLVGDRDQFDAILKRMASGKKPPKPKPKSKQSTSR
jgi:hypothetical protein